MSDKQHDERDQPARFKPGERRPRLRFRREPHERGLAGVCQGERGYDLMYGERRLGSVGRFKQPKSPSAVYYWSVGRYEDIGLEWHNTSATNKPVATIEEAKAEMLSYVKAALKTKGLL